MWRFGYARTLCLVVTCDSAFSDTRSLKVPKLLAHGFVTCIGMPKTVTADHSTKLYFDNLRELCQSTSQYIGDQTPDMTPNLAASQHGLIHDMIVSHSAIQPFPSLSA
jgi:hypothetical protein